jgi:hypothetical protein
MRRLKKTDLRTGTAAVKASGEQKGRLLLVYTAPQLLRIIVRAREARFIC